MTRYHLPTVAAAVFAMVWVTFRAYFQSIIHDEADAYLGFVAPTWPSHWWGANGNHVLVSVLMRLFTWMFGLSHLTVRAPVLLGDVIYLCAVYLLCTLVSNEELVIFPLFVCFVYNPLVMDYMVAARGYSLALGFLLIAIWIVARQILSYRPGEEAALYRAGALASASTGLSFSAHFGFAYVNASCMLLFFAWAYTRLVSMKQRARLAAAFVWPGLLIVLLISAGVLWKWVPGQIYLGTQSYSETWRTLLVPSFHELNRAIVNPLLFEVLDRVRRFLPTLAILLGLVQFALLAIRRAGLPGSRRSRQFQVAIFVAAVIVLTMFLHWVQFKLVKLPLPKERYGLFFVPLPLLVFGIVTAMGLRSAAGRILRIASIVVLFLGAAYFIGCLRLMYFREYRFGADVQAAFPVIQELGRRYGVREIPTSTDYASALNFYRIFYRDTSLEPFQSTDPPPSGKRIYVLPYGLHQQFIQKEGLKTVFRGELSDLVVLAREPLEPRAP